MKIRQEKDIYFTISAMFSFQIYPNLQMDVVGLLKYLISDLSLGQQYYLAQYLCLN